MKNVLKSLMIRSLHLSLALPLCAAAMSLGACDHELPAPVAPPPPAEEPAPPPPPKPEPVVEAPTPEPLALPGPVVFARGSDKLSPESEPALKQVVAYMSQEKEVTLLRIEGHTDNLGLRDQNQ